jgi:hypothetical protein
MLFNIWPLYKVLVLKQENDYITCSESNILFMEIRLLTNDFLGNNTVAQIWHRKTDDTIHACVRLK